MGNSFICRYLLAASPNLPESSSSSPLTSPQDEAARGTTPRVQGSWRKAIFERVCTPTGHESPLADSNTGELKAQPSVSMSVPPLVKSHCLLTVTLK